MLLTSHLLKWRLFIIILLGHYGSLGLYKPSNWLVYREKFRSKWLFHAVEPPLLVPAWLSSGFLIISALIRPFKYFGWRRTKKYIIFQCCSRFLLLAMLVEQWAQCGLVHNVECGEFCGPSVVKSSLHFSSRLVPQKSGSWKFVLLKNF